MKLSVFQTSIVSNTQTSIFTISFLSGLACANPVNKTIRDISGTVVEAQPTGDPCITEPFCSNLLPSGPKQCPATDFYNCFCSFVQADNSQCASCYSSLGSSAIPTLSTLQWQQDFCDIITDFIPTPTTTTTTALIPTSYPVPLDG
jgi:hypothetical protein